ncbi:hypothetical protein CYMTET_9633 [Cymbomonas tetramitiformis]|uniref:NLE domain-containing protein n=1 Tax=Cymbomonas tetramitiformis TaxID=36881 RepID=A0AAE0GSB7_9CHLO|nr:hypothetical protein CYMTET_9633 [Cymbomonas tetramitiformis]
MAEEKVEGNVIAQLVTSDGESTGPQLDLPPDLTHEQLEALLNELLTNEEKVPYAFFVNDLELTGATELSSLIQDVSVESVLKIVYHPQALFRVRPVARCSSTMKGHTEAVLSVQFSPDGRHLASGSGDTTVRLWNLNTEGPDKTCQGHKNHVLVVSFSPDGKQLVSGSMDKDVRLWCPKTGKARGLLKGHREWITSLAWEPAHLAYPSRRVASASRDTTIKVWDTATNKCEFTLSGHAKAVSCVKWSGEGLIFSSSRDTMIHVWETGEGKLIRTLKGHGHWVNTMALSTEHALRTGPYDHNSREPPEDPEEAKQIARARYDELRGGRPERMVSGSDDFTMFLWEPNEDKKHLARMTGHVQLINQVQFSPNGQWIVSASFDKSVKLWDGATGKFITSFFGHIAPVYQVAWSADSRLILSGSKDSTLKIWEVRTRKLKMDLPGHEDEVYSVDWSPNGWRVCSGSKDRCLKIWRN